MSQRLEMEKQRARNLPGTPWLRRAKLWLKPSRKYGQSVLSFQHPGSPKSWDMEEGIETLSDSTRVPPRSPPMGLLVTSRRKRTLLNKKKAVLGKSTLLRQKMELERSNTTVFASVTFLPPVAPVWSLPSLQPCPYLCSVDCSDVKIPFHFLSLFYEFWNAPL